jgi:Sulfotransferase family
MHRSGTTWVGRMLTASREAVYFHEPLNPACSTALLGVRVEPQYLYVSEENEDGYLQAFRRLLDFPLAARKAEQRPGQRLRRVARLAHARATSARALLKDPFAVFSIPWFARRLGAEVVVIVRHPLAIAGSSKRLAWGFDTSSLLSQPLLMRDRLQSFRAELEEQPTTIVGQAALLWRVVYELIRDDAREIPEVRIVRHEDLSRDPLGEFRRLYGSLGLNFEERAVRAIERTTSPRNPVETSAPESIELDSRAALQTWRNRLAREEIAQIERETNDLANQFYPEGYS